MTQQKPSFREGENNISTLLYLFAFLFIGFIFACKQKKVEKESETKSKIVSTQLTTPKTPNITLSRDSCLRVWRNLPITEDVALTELGVFFIW